MYQEIQIQEHQMQTFLLLRKGFQNIFIIFRKFSKTGNRSIADSIVTCFPSELPTSYNDPGGEDTKLAPDPTKTGKLINDTP